MVLEKMQIFLVGLLILMIFRSFALRLNRQTGPQCGENIEMPRAQTSFLELLPLDEINFECMWTIKVPLGKEIHLVFEHFLLTDNINCTNAFFELEDITGSTRYCQSGPSDRTHVSTGPSVQAKFFSSQMREPEEGIRLRLEWDVAPCHADFVNISRGTIFSPNYPEDYPNDKVCTWRLQVPIDYFITVDCTNDKFWIENSFGCRKDVLLISLNGRDDLQDADPFCGRRSPPPFESFGNSLTLLFKSNPYYHYTGFKCDFIAVPIGFPSTNGPPILPTFPTETPSPDPNVCGVCGVANNPLSRVFGGFEVIPNQFPWMVAIMEKIVNTTRIRQFCGGSMLNDRYILSAAHCFRRLTAENVLVDLGEHDIVNRVNTSSRVVAVSQIISHPLWETTLASADNDLAILKLATSVSYSRTSRPICLPPQGYSFEGLNVTVAGWGRTQPTNPNSSRVLMAANIEVLPLSVCENVYGVNQITVNMICAALRNPNRDACPGDSGGPLMLLAEDKWYLIGVVSAGAPNRTCGDTRYPGIYSRVNRYLDWIERNSQADSNCSNSNQVGF